MTDKEILLENARQKLLSAINVLANSLELYEEFDAENLYTPEDLIPYDALSDRFMRAVEVAIKYFKTWEINQYGEKSDVIRDVLNKVEKHELINNTELWLDMRLLRNKIVHDYLPEEREETYNLIVNEYSPELFLLKDRIK